MSTCFRVPRRLQQPVDVSPGFAGLPAGNVLIDYYLAFGSGSPVPYRPTCLAYDAFFACGYHIVQFGASQDVFAIMNEGDYDTSFPQFVPYYNALAK